MPDASGGRRGPEPRTVAFVYLAGLVQGVVMVSFAASSAVLRGRHGFSDTEYGSIFLPQVFLAALGAIGSGALSRLLDLRHVLALSFTAMALSQAALAGSHFLAPGLALAPLLALRGQRADVRAHRGGLRQGGGALPERGEGPRGGGREPGPRRLLDGPVRGPGAGRPPRPARPRRARLRGAAAAHGRRLPAPSGGRHPGAGGLPVRPGRPRLLRVLSLDRGPRLAALPWPRGLGQLDDLRRPRDRHRRGLVRDGRPAGPPSPLHDLPPGGALPAPRPGARAPRPGLAAAFSLRE